MTTVKIRINENYQPADRDKVIGTEHEAKIEDNILFGKDCAITEDAIYLSHEYDIIEKEGLKRGDFVVHTNDYLGPDERSVGVVLSVYTSHWSGEGQERVNVRWVWANKPDAFVTDYTVEMLRKIG